MVSDAQALIEEASVYYIGCGFEPATPWDEKRATELFRIAQSLLNRHDHKIGDKDPLTLENCGACELAKNDPNYAGWQRVYVEGRRAIGLDDLRAGLFRMDNPAYSRALLRSCLTYGVTIKPFRGRKSKRP
jgi:hypothetical protein